MLSLRLYIIIIIIFMAKFIKRAVFVYVNVHVCERNRSNRCESSPRLPFAGVQVQ